jgi:hypothetical protein
VSDALKLGAQPHAYRRIKPKGDGWVLAHKAWRFDFTIDGRRVLVTNVHTGCRPAALASGAEPELPLHREFVARFG